MPCCPSSMSPSSLCEQESFSMHLCQLHFPWKATKGAKADLVMDPLSSLFFLLLLPNPLFLIRNSALQAGAK